MMTKVSNQISYHCQEQLNNNDSHYDLSMVIFYLLNEASTVPLKQRNI